MKKSILNLGKALNKAEQKNINGGMFNPFCSCSRNYQLGDEYNNNGNVIQECTFAPDQGGPGEPFFGALCLGVVHNNNICCPFF